MNEEKKCSCVLCGAKLDSKEMLQEHFRKHANKEIDAKGNPIKNLPKNDSIEKDNISDADNLNKINKITCDVCPMQFDSVTMAIQHKFRKHPESSTKYFCPFCGMQFPIKFTRDKHVGTHKNMSTYGSFPCSECGEIFHNTQAQNYHFKSTHKRIMSIFKPVPTPPPSKKIKINNANEAQSVYYCYLCGMEYVIKFNLQKHLERSHKEDDRSKVPDNLIKCTTCDALFYNKKAYENHNMYHKPDDLYVTSEEQRLQTVSRVDQDFDIRRVQLVTDKFIPVDKPKSRRQNNIKSVQQKQENVGKPSTDDELSPTSSIDSSDSESEPELDNKEKNNLKQNEIDVKVNENQQIPKTSHIKIMSEKIIVKINPTFIHSSNDMIAQPKHHFNVENTIETSIPNEIIKDDQPVEEIIEAVIPSAITEDDQPVEETKKAPKKNSPKKRKFKSPQTYPTKRALRSNTNI